MHHEGPELESELNVGRAFLSPARGWAMQRPGGGPALEWNSERALKTKPKKNNPPNKHTQTITTTTTRLETGWAEGIKRTGRRWSLNQRQDSQMKEQMGFV